MEKKEEIWESRELLIRLVAQGELLWISFTRALCLLSPRNAVVDGYEYENNIYIYIYTPEYIYIKAEHENQKQACVACRLKP